MRYLTVFLFVGITTVVVSAGTPKQAGWSEVVAVDLRGGLDVYWNVLDNSRGENQSAAARRGFKALDLVFTYTDYPGQQRENINLALPPVALNPWKKPSFFERTVSRNIAAKIDSTNDIIVHDIEFNFEQSAAVAFANPETLRDSGEYDLGRFTDAYFGEWATWYTAPLRVTREMFPDAKLGLYGVQPFRRDYWGISGKNAVQIDGSHEKDTLLWRYIDSFVDFYIASIYIFYEKPDSVFYMAANVEENLRTTRAYGSKPVFAYTWLRYHDSNSANGNRELDEYLVEAMALVPYFSGAKAIVLWGHEPEVKFNDEQPYKHLPLFSATLARLEPLSQKIGNGHIVLDPPAHKLWLEKKPLVRTVVVNSNECVVLVIDPWQNKFDESKITVTCGSEAFSIPAIGRKATLAHIRNHKVEFY